MDKSILQSKLNRHKISFTQEKEKVVIGKPKTNHVTLIGLVILPIIAGIGICAYILLNDYAFAGRHLGKVIAGLVLLFGTGVFNLSRINSKKHANNNVKTLYDREIKLENEYGEYIFDSENIKDFEYSVEQIDNETYEGNLLLIDMKDRKHQILGFDDDNEQYALNDLKWFMEYLINHVGLNRK